MRGAWATTDASREFCGASWVALATSAPSPCVRILDAGAAVPAVALRIPEAVLLVVRLGEVERRRLADLRGDRPEPARAQRGLVGIARCECSTSLGLAVGVH